jgi:hypothetical protein
MAWSYDPTLATDKDRVRFMIGDTDTDDQQLQDEEILFLIEQYDTLYGAAAAAANALAAKNARYADKWVGDLKILASQMSRAYRELADRFSRQGVDAAMLAATQWGVPTAGGVYAEDKAQYEADPSLAQPFFKRGIHDNREAE